jgi:hypothetical protein
LHVLRVLVGLLLLGWLLPFAGYLDTLFGLQGWFDQKAYTEVGRLPAELFPPLGWSPIFLFGRDPGTLTVFYSGSIAVLVLFTLGVAPRLTSVLAWLVTVAFTSNPIIYYDGDVLLRILAFYVMLGYLPLGLLDEDQSLASRLLGRTWFLSRSASRPSLSANLALRLLQVHLAIVIVTSGLHKLQFGDWWGGVALWYALYPPLETTLADARAHANQAENYLLLLSLAAYAVLLWQLGFPLYAWRRRMRPVLLGGALIGWLGTAFIYRLPLIGPATLIGCLAFVTADEWRRLFGWLAQQPGLHWLARLVPPAAAEREAAGVRHDRAASPEAHFARSEAVTSKVQ